MATYMLTAFSKKGDVLLNEVITATNDAEAQTKGEMLLAEKELLESTHRLASPLGKLILFHS